MENITPFQFYDINILLEKRKMEKLVNRAKILLNSNYNDDFIELALWERRDVFTTKDDISKAIELAKTSLKP